MKDERRPICEVVAESIERLIIDGVLKVGQPLPSERRLCEKLGFSRSALREGLTVLRAGRRAAAAATPRCRSAHAGDRSAFFAVVDGRDYLRWQTPN